MANVGEIRYDFTASVSDLEQKAVVAQKIIEEKIEKQIDAVGTKSTVSDKKIVAMFKNAAKEGRALHPLLGKVGTAIAGIDAVVVPLYRSFETFFARLQPKLETFGMAIVSRLTTPLGLVAVGVTAVVAAGWAFNQFLSAGAIEARKYAKALDEIAKANAEIEKSTAKASLAAKLAGDPKAALRAQIAGARQSMELEAGKFAELTGFPEDTVTAAVRTGAGLLRPQRNAMDEQQARIRSIVNPGTAGESDAEITIRRQEEILRKAQAYYAELQKLETKLREVEERESAMASMEEEYLEAQKALEDQRNSAAVAAEKAAEKQAAASEKAAEKELAAQERLEEQSSERAQAEAERAAQEQAQHEARLNMVALAAAQVQQSQYAFYDWAASLQANMADVYQGIQGLVSMATQGIADSFARALVYGESFAEMMDALWKQMAASLISMVIQVALQQLVYLAMESLMVVAAATTKISAEMTYGVIAAAASAYASLPFPANMFAAPAAGAAALATMTALAGTAKAAGIGIGATLPGMAEGGLVTGAMLALVGEGGEKEMIAPRSDYERLFESARAGGDIAVYLDGQELTRSVAKRLPGELRKHGVR